MCIWAIWGLQMGQVIAEVHSRQPNLPYFDADRAPTPMNRQ
ncbi:MAG: hypothetical protein R2867_17450 [Caldilineaceae bacterium]